MFTTKPGGPNADAHVTINDLIQIYGLNTLLPPKQTCAVQLDSFCTDVTSIFFLSSFLQPSIFSANANLMWLSFLYFFLHCITLYISACNLQMSWLLDLKKNLQNLEIYTAFFFFWKRGIHHTFSTMCLRFTLLFEGTYLLPST